MAFPPPGDVPGPFGPGGSGFPPPGSGFPPPGAGFPPPGGAGPGPGFGGPIVVHRARLLPRLALVAGIMAVSLGVTAAIVWFAVLGTADDGRRAGGGAAAPTPAAEGVGAGVALPTGWPEALAPPADARIVTSVASSAGTPDEQLVLVVDVPGDGPAVVEALRVQLLTAGLTITSDTVVAGDIGSISAAGGGREATVAVSPNPARPGVTTVSWVLRPGPR